MTKTQTLDQAWHLIDFQFNLYTGVLAALTIAITIAAFFNWRSLKKKSEELDKRSTELEEKSKRLDNRIESVNKNLNFKVDQTYNEMIKKITSETTITDPQLAAKIDKMSKNLEIRK